ncbi:MAG: outer membrane protein assembly factor BamC [Endozoicomonadaceae bacterium]|nr:outer membrane protein assembly factor BamC [Endozoicomonadaceae bacterium]
MYHVTMWSLVAISLLLGGCSSLTGDSGYFRDKSEDYIGEKIYNPLVLPETLHARETSEYYKVPSIDNETLDNVGREVLRPDRRIESLTHESYSIQRIGGRYWLIADNKSPKDIWPELLKFWSTQKIPMAMLDTSSGIMETDWVLNRESMNRGMASRLVYRATGIAKIGPQDDRFRLMVSQGAHAGISKIQLQQISRSTGSDTEVVWADADVGENMLNELLMFFVQDKDDGSVSLVASSSNMAERSVLIYDGNGNPVLKIGQPFARSWQAISVALNEIKITVTDQNRSFGVFYIELDEQVIKEEKKKSLFRGFFSGASDDQEQRSKIAHRLVVSQVVDGVQVALEKDANTLPMISVSEKVLKAIKSHLD